ncbi:hypothetical protein NS115_01690 [Paenibacillus jamilae]|uniref:Uncharacterized protein n=1 Tax=Paenibacillus jamilae TaxID=114136 RepID=A0ACC5A0R5_9BACL|nr:MULTISPECIES: hypothetical protein [Paenibacillus]AUO08172.1 hypothetical protein C0638_17300 [Paenibacillus sp. lzh-N1]KTS85029.1 hypothetical protein NS115_01690 [Paenibacillus jamilae]
MPKVFVHTHDMGKANWENQYFDFGRIPVEGDFFALSSDSPWYQVELIVHTPFKEDLAAEIYGVKVEHEKVKRTKLSMPAKFEF